MLRRLLSNKFLLSAAPGMLLLVAALFYIPILNGYWLADDFAWLSDFAPFGWRDMGPLFLGNWARSALNEYRPLWALSFFFDLRVWGVDPFAFHLTNLVWHVVASLLLWLFVRRMDISYRLAAMLSLAFFILAPVHVEAVAWISARGHILAAIFILCTFLFFVTFKQHRQSGQYIASLGAAVAAFATQEVAVALPFLLFAYDITEQPRLKWQWLFGIIGRQSPFALLLLLYLGFRFLIFGELGRDTVPASLIEGARDAYLTLRTLWVSFTPAIFTDNLSERIKILFMLLMVGLLISPLWSLRRDQRGNYASKLLYFAILWPTIAIAVLMGANSQRHLYLASVGPTIALGLAGASLLSTKGALRILAISAVGALMVMNGLMLVEGVQEFRLRGEWSWQLRTEVDEVLAQAAQEPASSVVILPEVPNNSGVLWNYFYPFALLPPFTEVFPTVPILPSFASCHCPPEEWLETHAATLEHLLQQRSGLVYVVEWNGSNAAFTTNRLSQEAFFTQGYMQPGGSVVRPRRPDLPSPLFP